MQVVLDADDIGHAIVVYLALKGYVPEGAITYDWRREKLKATVDNVRPMLTDRTQFARQYMEVIKNEQK